MQEAYHPPRSMCSLLFCPGGYHSPGRGGVPHPHLAGSTPWLGLGYPQSELGYPPERTWDQFDLGKNLELGYPPERTWDQWPGKESGTGSPPSSQVWTGKQTENITFTHPSDVGSNESSVHFYQPLHSTREGYGLTCVCLAVHGGTPTGQGGTPDRSSQGGIPVYPQPGMGYPHPDPGCLVRTMWRSIPKLRERKIMNPACHAGRLSCCVWIEPFCNLYFSTEAKNGPRRK